MESWEYIIQTKKEHIDFINKIMEAYEGLGNVRTLDSKNGIIKILTNSFFLDDVDRFLVKMTENDVFIEIIEKRKWLGVI